MSLEHRFRHVSDDETEVMHSAIVIQNPFAAIPIAATSFGRFTQVTNILGVIPEEVRG